MKNSGKLTTPILLAQIWKPPDIAKANAVTDDAEEELHFAAPRGSVFIRVLSSSCILIGGHNNRNVMTTLAFLIQGCQLVPITRVFRFRNHFRILL